MTAILQNAVRVERTGGSEIEAVFAMHAPCTTAIIFGLKDYHFGTKGSNWVGVEIVWVAVRSLVGGEQRISCKWTERVQRDFELWDGLIPFGDWKVGIGAT